MWGEVDSERGMRRLHYPQSEYDNNTENVQAAVTLLGGPDPARHMTSSEYADSQWKNLGF